jgi:2-polyprenyl-3-methyl-5-hydroxy-6-metoxy-1,4-benzoquinol methylase
MHDSIVSSVVDDWWYYNVELAPGLITTGTHLPRVPMMPRMLLRNASLEGMDCLDIGSMEGLIPTLMKRQGANRVLATDALPHCEKKMNAIKTIYDVDFDFRQIGLLYDLSAKLKDQVGFDFVNLSGVLYHVFSPMHVLAGVRPLLKRNGLMIVSTNVMRREGHTLEYNHRGQLQTETNTFWYHSVPMLEALIRFFKMVPIDCYYCPHSDVNPANYAPGVDSGYMSVMCRAVDDADIQDADVWAAGARMASWEFLSLCNGQMMNEQARSSILYRGNPEAVGSPSMGIDLFRTIANEKHIVRAVDDSRDAHTLRLDDRY